MKASLRIATTCLLATLLRSGSADPVDPEPGVDHFAAGICVDPVCAAGPDTSLDGAAADADSTAHLIEELQAEVERLRAEIERITMADPPDSVVEP